MSRTLKSSCNAAAVLLILCAIPAAVSNAASLGSVRGTVLDSHNSAIKNATVSLQSMTSGYIIKTVTGESGEFSFRAVPIGDYQIFVEATGFRTDETSLRVTSENVTTFNAVLEVGAVSEKVTVTGEAGQVAAAPPTSTNLVSRGQIEQTPGADRTNSLSLITDYVPGAYMTHDQLHVRGGHQVSWLIDGVPVPNTNIASNVGPQFDPKDVDYLEVQTGGYSAEFGDRAYGVLNVLPRTGFERDREAELVLSFGNFLQTNDQFSFGDHNEKMAYYVSLNGNRSDFGLATPTADVLHDRQSGFGGFGSFVYLPSDKDQLRLVASARSDHYQIPNDQGAQLAGIDDVENESDAFLNFSWIRTIGKDLLLTVSPFYHFNRADFIGGPNDVPLSPQERRDSHYAGGQVTIGALTKKHDFRAGVYSFFQHDSSFFGIKANDGSGTNLQQQETINGGIEAAFLEDQFKALKWLTLTGGLRLTHFGGAI
ncbi:MAG TPA: TonB-dependent receptor, partial [Blastocatellia bacterium]|nr:TonB-dependent receptor [Blastocatellia bacterium]